MCAESMRWRGSKLEKDSFFFSSRRRHTRLRRAWSSDVCSSDLYFRSCSSTTTGSNTKLPCCERRCWHETKPAQFSPTSRSQPGPERASPNLNAPRVPLARYLPPGSWLTGTGYRLHSTRSPLRDYLNPRGLLRRPYLPRHWGDSLIRATRLTNYTRGVSCEGMTLQWRPDTRMCSTAR